MRFGVVGGLDTEMPNLLSADGAWVCFGHVDPSTLFPFSHLGVSEMDEALSKALFWEFAISDGHLRLDTLTVHFFSVNAVNKSKKQVKRIKNKKNANCGLMKTAVRSTGIYSRCLVGVITRHPDTLISLPLLTEKDLETNKLLKTPKFKAAVGL